MSNYLKIADLSETDVTSASITNCFTADYDTYEILMTAKRPSGSSTTNTIFRFLDNTNTAITTADYHRGQFRKFFVNTGLEIDASNSATGLYITGNFGIDNDNTFTFMTIANPYQNDRYTNTFIFNNSKGHTTSNDWRAYFGQSGLKLTTQVTGIEVSGNGGNIDINLQVYAYKKD